MSLTFNGVFNLSLAGYLAALLLAIANLFAKKRPLAPKGFSGLAIAVTALAGRLADLPFSYRDYSPV
jgi:hypothetical protein